MKTFKTTSNILFKSIIIFLILFSGCKKNNNDDGNNPSNETGTFTDSRDSHVYKWVKIGDQTWMAENLAYKPANGYKVYDNDESNIKTYGYLYNWEVAQSIAPQGWHLPSKEEWQELVNTLGGKTKAYNKLLEKGTAHWNSPNKATNESGFTAVPSGYYDTRYDEFTGMNHLAMYHSTDINNVALTLNQNSKEATIEGKPLDMYVAVRCIKDK